VLEGITRGIVLQLAAQSSLAIDLVPPRAAALASWQEAFLTSSTRAVVPVVALAGQRVGDGHPGPVTARLLGAYEEHAERAARRAWSAAPPAQA